MSVGLNGTYGNIVGYHQQLLEMCSSAHEVYPESVACFFAILIRVTRIHQ
jgi:hypothetical protein